MYKFKKSVSIGESAEVVRQMPYVWANGRITQEAYDAYPEFQTYFELDLPILPRRRINFSEAVKMLRTKYGLDQTQLAQICGVAQQTVSKWELGQSQPRGVIHEYIFALLDDNPELLETNERPE